MSKASAFPKQGKADATRGLGTLQHLHTRCGADFDAKQNNRCEAEILSDEEWSG